MVSRKTMLTAAVIMTIYLTSLSYYVYFYQAETAIANSVDIYISVVAGKTANANASFSPDSFVVVEGKRVTLVVSNGDTTSHTLAIPEFNVTTGAIPAGDTVQVSFNADKTGTFQFDEPSAGCGPSGGHCTSAGSEGEPLTGNMTVIPQTP
jgi:heme/copper-type cytochrome/quinol oxidase subunit 2